MRNRMERITDVNFLSFIIQGVATIFNLSPMLFLISLGLAVVTLIMGVINLCQIAKLVGDLKMRRKLLCRIMWQLFISVGLIAISAYCYF